MSLDTFGSPVSPCLKPKNFCSKEAENEGKQAVEIDVFNLGNKERESSTLMHRVLVSEQIRLVFL
jgi:hypothetical protein